MGESAAAFKCSCILATSTSRSRKCIPQNKSQEETGGIGFDTIQQNLKGINLTSEEAWRLSVIREDWCRSSAQCVIDIGLTKAYGVKITMLLTWVLFSPINEGSLSCSILRNALTASFRNCGYCGNPTTTCGIHDTHTEMKMKNVNLYTALF